ENDLARQGGELVDYQRQDDADQLDAADLQRAARRGSELRLEGANRVDESGPEPDRVAVAVVERQPGELTVLGRCGRPFGEQRRLAVSRWRLEEGHPARPVDDQRVDQPPALDELR